jgi:hypothetical protein
LRKDFQTGQWKKDGGNYYCEDSYHKFVLINSKCGRKGTEQNDL